MRSDETYYILIVDDEANVVRSLERQLRGWVQKSGLGVITAPSAERAWEFLDDPDYTVAILLSDNRMPGMSGAELIHRLVREGRNTIPVLLTGYTAAEDLQSAHRSGVFGLLTKPWSRDDLLEELHGALDAYMARVRAGQGAEPVRREFRTARALQQYVLTPAQDWSVGGVTVRYAQRTAGPLGVTGDYVDLIPLDDHRLLIVVGRISRRDLRSIATLAVIRGASRGALEVDLERDDAERPVAAFVRRMNALILPLLGDEPDLFLTLTTAIVDTATREVRLASAGSPRAVLAERDGTVLPLPDTDFAVGVNERVDPVETNVTLHGGTRVYLFTDGVEDRLVEKAITATVRDPAATVEGIVHRLRSAIPPTGKNADLTVCEIRVATEESGR